MDIPAAAPAQSGNQSEPGQSSPTIHDKSIISSLDGLAFTIFALRRPPITIVYSINLDNLRGSATRILRGLYSIHPAPRISANRLNDDKWITEYASTCFDGDALFWYLELEKKYKKAGNVSDSLSLVVSPRFLNPPRQAPSPAPSQAPQHPPWVVYRLGIPEGRGVASKS
ncbi:hypothetical protein FRC04_004955 [Tulasnella sp. 424]|nr:hypothetical protein FRC04_004955 [Tulasnella sp. 424]